MQIQLCRLCHPYTLMHTYNILFVSSMYSHVHIQLYYLFHPCALMHKYYYVVCFIDVLSGTYTIMFISSMYSLVQMQLCCLFYTYIIMNTYSYVVYFIHMLSLHVHVQMQLCCLFHTCNIMRKYHYLCVVSIYFVYVLTHTNMLFMSPYYSKKQTLTNTLSCLLNLSCIVVGEPNL